jgi:hypothetical protein
LRFLINFFSKYSIYFYTSPPLPGCFVTVTLNNEISIYLDILNSLYDQLQHENIMSHLANSYYNYVVNKVNHLNTIILKDGFYELSNLKPIIKFKLDNLYTFTFKCHNINIYFPIINMFNICLQNIYIIIPAIIFTLKPLLNTFSNKLNVLLEELLNLSKISWYLIIDNIIRHNYNKIKYKIIWLLLGYLIEQFKIRMKINDELIHKHGVDDKFFEDYPLFDDPDEVKERARLYKEWADDQDEIKEILKTIRILEKIIINNFNSNHVVFPTHFLDQYLYWDADDSYFDDDSSNNDEYSSNNDED